MMGDCIAAILCKCEKAAIYGTNFSVHTCTCSLNLISPDVYSKYMI